MQGTDLLLTFTYFYTCVQGYGKGSKDRDDDDDAGSVSSERSSYSISSEVSVNPYARYTQPVTVSYALYSTIYKQSCIIYMYSNPFECPLT